MEVDATKCAKISDKVAVSAVSEFSTSSAVPKIVQYHQANVKEQVANHGEGKTCPVIGNEGQSDRQNQEEQE